MHAIRIDRAKRLADEPHSGHNRYHPHIAAALEVAEGEEVILETRDALDGQLGRDATVADLEAANSFAGSMPNKYRRAFGAPNAR